MIEFARFFIRRVFDFQCECSFRNEKKEMWNLVLYEINIVKRIGRILYDFAQLVWIVISIILFTKIYKMINSWIGELKNSVIIILDSLRFVFILIFYFSSFFLLTFDTHNYTNSRILLNISFIIVPSFKINAKVNVVKVVEIFFVILKIFRWCNFKEFYFSILKRTL